MVEHRALNQEVLGLIPTGGTVSACCVIEQDKLIHYSSGKT